MRLNEIDKNLQEIDIRAFGNAIRSISKMNPDQEAHNLANWFLNKKLPQAIQDKKDQQTIKKIERRNKQEQNSPQRRRSR